VKGGKRKKGKGKKEGRKGRHSPDFELAKGLEMEKKHGNR